MRPGARVLENALLKYNQTSVNNLLILCYRDLLMSLLEGESLGLLTGTYVITTSPIGNIDDDIMWLFCFIMCPANLVVIISNGHNTANERLVYMKETYPDTFGDIEFNKPFYHSDESFIIFLEDGYDLNGFSFDGFEGFNGFVNAGPCHSDTLLSIATCLIKSPDTRVITIGANDDCSMGLGINQKQTNESGKLIIMEGIWETFLFAIRGMGLRNASVDMMTSVLLPNPTMMGDSYYNKIMGTKGNMDKFIANLGMFFAARPQPRTGLCTNQYNSVVVGQFADIIIGNMTEEQKDAAFIRIEEYKAWAVGLKLTPEYYESAAIPIFLTYGLGGVYKPYMFGWEPGKVINDLSCLTPESVEVFKDNLMKLPFFTPSYNVIGFLMLTGI